MAIWNLLGIVAAAGYAITRMSKPKAKAKSKSKAKPKAKGKPKAKPKAKPQAECHLPDGYDDYYACQASGRYYHGCTWPPLLRGGERFGSWSPCYRTPHDWDPISGLWISPSDCGEAVVEAAGWYCGWYGELKVEGGKIYDHRIPNTMSQCTAIEFESYTEAMAEPGNGVAGYVAWLIRSDREPEDIAFQILTEISPLCADVPWEYWPAGLSEWYVFFLKRVTSQWEVTHGY